MLDAVLRDVDAELAARPPERGGALLGPPGRPVVTRFLADPDGRSTGATWVPSRALAERVREVEREEGLELKGLVHSHPPGLERPSDADRREIGESLRRNGHLACVLAPIVSGGARPEGAPESDEGFSDAPSADAAPDEVAALPLPRGRVAFFAGWRVTDGDAELRPLAVEVLPLAGDLERLAAALGGGRVDTLLADLAGAAALPAGAIALADAELLVVAGDAYPALPPALLWTDGERTRQLEVAWAPGLDAGARVERMAAAARAARALPEGALLARAAGILTPVLGARRVLVAGCGSVGSYLAEALVRAGVGAVALVDPETVEPANLSRTAYEARDLGAAKVDALARRLRAASPGVAVDARRCGVEDLAPAALDALVRGADLVLAATDDPAAQRTLNRFAYARGRPALFVGLYAGADGGEVVLSSPERTACYLCATRTRHEAERTAGRVARDTEYGTGRLAAEPALGVDVQHVASAAAKLALSLLVKGEPGARLAAFAEEVVDGGATYLTMSTVPRYWFYPQVFGDAAGQGAWQSVWLTPARGEDCPVCGEPAARVDPLDAPVRGPSRDAFR